MNDPRLEAIVRAAIETQSIDFKAAMNWKTSTTCDKYEILRDVAAISNSGGGYLVFGRDEPNLKTGGMSTTDADSFDPTPFNRTVHNNLQPAIECLIAKLDIDGDIVIVVQIPEFERTPLIFKEVGNCSVHVKAPHFQKSDIFVRSKAMESRRVETPEEMHDLINRAIRKSSDDLVISIQRMLTSAPSVEEPLAESPYDAEYAHEHEAFFKPLFYPWTPWLGHFDMSVRPVLYRENRLALRDTPRRILEWAAVVGRNGNFDAAPHDGHEQEKIDRGARLRLLKPEWHRVEGVSLKTSGLYRLVRAFHEDFETGANNGVEQDRVLNITTLVEQMTLFHLLARNIARDLLQEDVDEEVQFDLRVDGLLGRRLQPGAMDMLKAFLIGVGTQPGSTASFAFPLRITRRALEIEAVTLARDRCERMLWTFGIQNANIAEIQRALLGGTEPQAFPR